MEGDISGAGIEVMLTARRVQAGSPELFSGAGIDPLTKRLIIVKSMQHFHAGFAPISARVIYTGDRGALAADVRNIPYQPREHRRILAIQIVAEVPRLTMRLPPLVARYIMVAALASINSALADEPQSDDIGVLTTPDAGEVTMPFANLTYTGVGRFVWNDGRSYAGDFVDGHPQGRGIEQTPDGSRYDGEWRDGVRSGSGSMTLPDGSRYDGQFEDGVRSGAGLFQSAAGRYQGDWADDVPQGEGRFDYIDGASYDGHWFSGRRNGLGIYRRPDGSSYEGDWLDDMPDGYGRLVESDDYTYEGAWSKGQRAGYGAMQIGGTFGYEGTWVANMRQGFGREVRPDGGEYTGEWHADQRAGIGVLRMPNGAFHDGLWKHNSPVGEGTRVSAEGIKFVGAWDGDFLTSGHLELGDGQHYDGKLYDSKRKIVDPAYPGLARTHSRAGQSRRRRCCSARHIGSF